MKHSETWWVQVFLIVGLVATFTVATLRYGCGTEIYSDTPAGPVICEKDEQLSLLPDMLGSCKPALHFLIKELRGSCFAGGRHVCFFDRTNSRWQCVAIISWHPSRRKMEQGIR